MRRASILLGLVLITSPAAAWARPSPRIPDRDARGLPHLRSESVIVRYADTGQVVLEKNADAVRPIASVTKLLSGLVLARVGSLPAGPITILEDDKDKVKWSRSRIRVGRSYPATELQLAALGASDNRAMYALARATGMARGDFVGRMNALAREIGMARSRFVDPAGIEPSNVSTARDLLALVAASAEDERVRSATRTAKIELTDAEGRTLALHNPDRLAQPGSWDLVVGKTGYTIEAGRTLAARVRVDGRPVDMVFLGSREMKSVFGDAGRVRRWLLERRTKA